MAPKKNTVLKDTSVAERPIQSSSYDGLIAAVGAEAGISGWVTNSEPTESLSLELIHDGVVVREFGAVRSSRAEIAGSPDEAFFEFALAQQELGAFGDFSSDILSGTLSIRVAGTGFQLPCADDAKIVEQPADEDFVTLEIVRNHDLFDHLGHLKARCESLLSLPLRPRPEHRGGYIEAICFDDQVSGLYWFIGWKYASDVIDTSAVVVDEKKFSAAFSIASFPRQDLPAGAHGIIGVIRSEWRPKKDSRPIVYYGDDADHNLRCVSELRKLSKGEFLSQLHWARQCAPKNNWADLFALFDEQGSWVANAATRPDVHLAVDRLVVLDGCGCFVTGWALSFVHPVATFALKFGSEVLAAEAESLRFIERSDLAQAFPGAQHIQSRAGFLCFFEGNLDMRLSEAPQIKAILENGRSVVFPVDITQVRRLGYSEPIETLEQFYPSIQHMDFFGKVASSVRENHRRQASVTTVHQLAECESCVIIACSDNVQDTHLVLDDVLRNAAAHLPEGWGIVLAVGSKVAQGLLLSMIASGDHDLRRRLSIVSCPKPASISLCLPEILRITGADRFVVVGGDSILTDAGWAAMKELDRSDLNDLVVLEAVDPNDGKPTESAASFAWNADSFKAWAQNMPVLLDEQFARGDLAGVSGGTVPGATNLLRRLMPSRVASLLNVDARKRHAANA